MTKKVTITDKDLLRIEKASASLRFFFRSHSRPHIENIVTFRKGKWGCDCGAVMFGVPHDCPHILYLKKTTTK